ncbi:MAG: ATPase [Clostridiales bacterium]|nr:ATPase [Clostridiales bacterium]
MKVLELLDEFESKLEVSSSIPFSGKILIDRNEISNLLKEIQLLLPDEIKHAKWIKDERNKIIDDAKRDADRIVNEAQTKETQILRGAKDQFDHLLDEHKVVELARQKSDMILSKAKADAEEIKKNAFLYSYDIISKAYNNMIDVTELLENNKNELKKYIDGQEKNK